MKNRSIPGLTLTHLLLKSLDEARILTLVEAEPYRLTGLAMTLNSSI